MFKYGSSTIEVVSEYVYQSVTMMHNNKYAKAIKKRWLKQEFFFFITKYAQTNCLPIDIQCDMLQVAIDKRIIG